MRFVRPLLRGGIPLAALALTLGIALPSSLSAQEEARQIARQVTGQEWTQLQIVERLRSSGLSREQARARLRQGGYDPSLVDPYYDQIEGRGEPTLPGANRDFVTALESIGVLEAGVEPPVPSIPTPDVRPEPVASGEEGPRVFGLEVFRRATDQFEPVLTGPVDPDYRLGPGDQIILILTGDVELAYTLEVTREGFIVIPDVGQLSVNGLTLESLRDRLYDRLGRVYSGVRREPDATTRFDVSLGRLRTNQVFVIGDVARPGAFQLSSVGTVLNALYAGGGPTFIGSFRSVTVSRRGRILGDVDLYEYLLRGDASRDLRLEQGDIVFVPPVGSQVTVQGRVRRPAVYEVKPGETLQDLLGFAGGFHPEAHIRRIQVERVLPPAQREPGRERVLVDVDVEALLSGMSPPFFLEAGDEITVTGVLDRRVGRVVVEGDVWRPGGYQFTPGMTVWDLIGEAQGLAPSAYRPVVHVRRLIPETGATRLLRVSLETDGDGRPLGDLALEELDEVVVFSEEELRTREAVEILGEVKVPGRYPLSRDATVEDLILAAGGFGEGALASEAEVVRLRPGLTRSDSVAVRYRVRIEGGIPHPLGDEAFRAPSPPEPYDGVASQFRLLDHDRLYIRRLPGFTGSLGAQVRGEVLFPGSYGFETRQERLTDLVRRAGGLTTEAHAAGARLVRGTVPVAIELDEALGEPGGAEDILVEAGDELVVPRYDPTVQVTGAVLFPSRVVYRPGMSFKAALEEAGGAARNADMGRAVVEYASGRRAASRRFLFFRTFPELRAGSTIVVPAKDEAAERDWDQLLMRSLSITTSILTLLVAWDRLN